MTTFTSKAAPAVGHHKTFWLWVMCLTGVDYFSTLGYQPSIAVRNAGLLAPVATVVLVLVTLLAALPLYRYVATRSFDGQASLGMMARLITGWPGKIAVLVLLGFAATDFVITKTLSAADAAEHLISNPFWPLEHADRTTEDRQRLVVTLTMLVILGATFLRGFREVIGLAVGIVGSFLVLNAIVVVCGLLYVTEHTHRLTVWFDHVRDGEWYLGDAPLRGGGPVTLAIVVLLIFPKLALGLSGFETGVAVMPLIRGSRSDTPDNPAGRIRNTGKLLLTAAVIMSGFLMASSLVVSTVIEPTSLVDVDAHGNPVQTPDGKRPPAAGRALAYLAHGEGDVKLAPFFGNVFGTIYDLVTVVILWFAGASAMAGLLNLVPQYLPRYGMAPEWARAHRPLVILIASIALFVTWIFNADVEAQGDAYATGVLVLMSSDSVTSLIDKFRRREGRPWYRRLSWWFLGIAVVFTYTLGAIVIEKTAGIKIASFFIAAILILSIASRIARARELRFQGFHIPDPVSKLLWDTIRHLELSILVPHRPGRRSLTEKETVIRKEHRLPADAMVVFVEVELEDPSEFHQKPTLQIKHEEGKYILKITDAASISHTLAALALEMSKVGQVAEIHFGWTDESPVSGTLGFLLFGEGNVPWMVRELIHKAEPNPARRPLIIIAGQ
ncbi:MAG: amino acid transporter [Zavarzinella sp.]|nr:amino acid transporter [Zavarzinella sp.]